MGTSGYGWKGTGSGFSNDISIGTSNGSGRGSPSDGGGLCHLKKRKILLLKRSDFKSLFLFIKVIVAAGKRKLPVEVAEAV